ncbi:uncharacterized protein [Drosophila tropicalis]|uniref:uncharacterized protein n=1 Tax=Drosophila tropicalis TaxID=46794 RepID=UPI0035AB6C5E
MLLEIGKRASVSAYEVRAGTKPTSTSKLIGQLIEEEDQLSAMIEIAGRKIKATIDSGATSNFMSRQMAENLRNKGDRETTNKQVYMADGKIRNINEQWTGYVRFGNKEMNITFLIMPDGIDALILGWNFLRLMDTEIACGGHRIQIPTTKRMQGRITERISIMVTKKEEQAEIHTFLEHELMELAKIKGPSKVGIHRITIKDDIPIKQRCYPKNPKMQAEINAKVDELLKLGCIEPSQSPYSSPIVMVKKKQTGKWRLCVDFRQINAKSIKDAYPMPRIDYILNQLREARFISSLHLKDGYWQIPLEDRSSSIYSPRERFIPVEDASNMGLGAILIQNTEEGERVLSYLSRELNSSERNYSATEKECLAIVWAVRKLRPYLEGYHFKVVTDHMALKWLNSIDSPTGRIARWALELHQYDFEISYRKGKLNIVADALSRQPIERCNRITDNGARLRQANKECEWIQEMMTKIKQQPQKYADYVMENSQLYRNIPHRAGQEEVVAWKMCVPKSLRQQIMEGNHTSATAGHTGSRRTIARTAASSREITNASNGGTMGNSMRGLRWAIAQIKTRKFDAAGD